MPKQTAIFILIAGLTLTVIGAVLYFLPKLPGDIIIQRKNFTLYFPIVTSIILSIVLTLVLNIVLKK